MSGAVAGGRRELAALWFGFLGPPVLWAARLCTAYVLVPAACDRGGLPALHAVTAAALAGTIAAGFVAWRRWRAAATAEGPAAAGEPTGGRTRFLGIAGVLSAALFATAIVAEGLANVLVDPCLVPGPVL